MESHDTPVRVSSTSSRISASIAAASGFKAAAGGAAAIGRPPLAVLGVEPLGTMRGVPRAGTTGDGATGVPAAAIDRLAGFTYGFSISALFMYSITFGSTARRSGSGKSAHPAAAAVSKKP